MRLSRRPINFTIPQKRKCTDCLFVGGSFRLLHEDGCYSTQSTWQSFASTTEK